MFDNSSPETNNSSQLEISPLEWNVLKTSQSVIFGAVVLGTVIGNFLTLVVFVKYKKYLRSPTHYFLANLALADIFVGILALPYLAVFSITLRWYFGVHFCYAWTALHFWFCSSSILSTLAICIERFIGVKYPLRHLQILNKRSIYLIIFGVWSLSLFLSVVPLAIWPESPSERPLDCKINLRLGHVLAASIGIFHLPATAMGILYFMIYKAATAPMKLMKDNAHHLKEKQKNQVKLAKKLAFLVGFLVISYLPMFTTFLVLGFNPTLVPLDIFILLAWLRYFNSCVNPLIYAFSVPGFKKALKEFMGRKQEGKRIHEISNNTTSTL